MLPTVRDGILLHVRCVLVSGLVWINYSNGMGRGGFSLTLMIGEQNFCQAG
jgi:hypothetical protein